MRLTVLTLLCVSWRVFAGVGDPQVATDHDFYPGELACSTFERLFEEQRKQYARMTGVAVTNDHHRVLASWAWRNTHYAHGEEGAQDLWGKGFTGGGDLRGREYWTGLFAHGFGLCGTTHSQWTAEMECLLGHGRARGVGVIGHNSFEVFLKGGPYGQGRWALLDHDISTVVFDSSGQRLLSIDEVKADPRRWTDRTYEPAKQNGWLPCGLHAGDGSAYREFNTAEYLAGYASVPPIVHLRAGETMRRYFKPGLEDGKTFVFWGRNYKTAGVPGPERSLTWVNQPEKMYGSTAGTAYSPGQVRYGNVVYEYTPDFESSAYKEGVVDESDTHVTFEFYTPYIIGATPPNDKPWGIYDPGCRNGLILRGRLNCDVSVSTDSGANSQRPGKVLDLTDFVKGHRHYLLRLHASAADLRNSGLVIRTVCQGNTAVFPRLRDNGSTIRFQSSQRAVVSAGPNLRLCAPRGEPPLAVYAAAHIASGNPPDPNVTYAIEYSVDDGQRWRTIVRDWKIPLYGEQPRDFWSQSFGYGSTNLTNADSNVLVRFTNSGSKKVLRAEAHLVYRTPPDSPTRVTYRYTDALGSHRESHRFEPGTSSPAWKLATSANTQTEWVEFAPLRE